jgi:hypothetical protein
MYERSVFHSIVAFHSFCLVVARIPCTAQSYVFAKLCPYIANMYVVMSIVFYFAFTNQYYAVIWRRI